MKRYWSIGFWIPLLLALVLAVAPWPAHAQDTGDTTPIDDATKKAIEDEVKAQLSASDQKENECKEPEVSFSNLTNDTFYSATFRSDPAARYSVCFFLTDDKEPQTSPQASPQVTAFSAMNRVKAQVAPAAVATNGLWGKCKEIASNRSNTGVDAPTSPLTLIAAGEVEAAKDAGTQMPIRLRRETFDQLLRHEGWIVMYYESFADDCEEVVSGWRVRPMFERHSLQVGLGAAYRQKEEGGFDGQFDLGFHVQSRWRSMWSTAFDFRLLGLGESSEDSADDMDDETATMPETSESRMSMGTPEMGMMTEKDINPFERQGTFAQADLWLGLHPWRKGAFALVAGAGVRTLPGSDDLGADARGRFMFGFRVDSAGLNIKQDSKNFGRAKHSLTVAYAYDRAWQLPETDTDDDPDAPQFEEELDRLWIDARLTLFESDQQTFRLVPRITFDTPIDGDGPSDLRIAIMGAVDLDKLMGWGQVK